MSHCLRRTDSKTCKHMIMSVKNYSNVNKKLRQCIGGRDCPGKDDDVGIISQEATSEWSLGNYIGVC